VFNPSFRRAPTFPIAVRKAPDRVRGRSCLSCSLFYQPALTRVRAGRFPCIYLSSSVEFPTPASARTAELGFRSPLVEAGPLIRRVKPATVRLRDFLIVFCTDNGRISGGVPVTRKTNLKRRPTSGAPMNHLDLHSPLGAKYDVTRDIGIVLGTCSPYESRVHFSESFSLAYTFGCSSYRLYRRRYVPFPSRDACTARRMHPASHTLLNRDVGHFSCFRASLWNLSRLEARSDRVY